MQPSVGMLAARVVAAILTAVTTLLVAACSLGNGGNGGDCGPPGPASSSGAAATGQWTQVPFPSASGSLGGVAVVSDTDAWAVGAGNTVLAHWDGVGWTPVGPPSYSRPAPDLSLHAVATAGLRAAWAVGALDGKALIERWDGAHWSVAPGATVPLPDPPDSSHLMWRYDGVDLWSVALQPNGDLWAVGDVMQQHLAAQPLIEHYTPSG